MKRMTVIVALMLALAAPASALASAGNVAPVLNVPFDSPANYNGHGNPVPLIYVDASTTNAQVGYSITQPLGVVSAQSYASHTSGGPSTQCDFSEDPYTGILVDVQNTQAVNLAYPYFPATFACGTFGPNGSTTGTKTIDATNSTLGADAAPVTVMFEPGTIRLARDGIETRSTNSLMVWRCRGAVGHYVRAIGTVKNSAGKTVYSKVLSTTDQTITGLFRWNHVLQNGSKAPHGTYTMTLKLADVLISATVSGKTTI